jgi:SulP family sulfate permease
MISKILNYLSPNTFKNDILSGITVALALVPEAIAFAFIARVDPIIALYAAFLVSFITSLLSGRPGMISGATGALAVVMTSLVIEYGVQYLFATVILMGILQLLAGVFGLGKFAKIIPHPVMLGFVNGLAIVIFLAQIQHFQTNTPSGTFGFLNGDWLSFSSLFLMLGLTFLTMLIIYILPKFTKIIPAPLAAIGIISVITIIFSLNTPTVLDMLKGGNITASFPNFLVPDITFSFETFKIIFPYALILSLIGLIESLMTLSLIDEITDTRGENNKECLAQGTANVVTGFFGGMGGCAMVGQSMINIQSGGRGRLSGIIAGVVLLLFILFGSNIIESIPLAALIGVMFMVVIGTFAWSSFRIIKKIPKSDAFILIFVSIVTVFTDLAFAVISGIIISALVFVWEKSKEVCYKVSFSKDKKIKYYNISGIIFFGSIDKFKNIFDIKNDPSVVYIDFKNTRLLDHSAINYLDQLDTKYKKNNKELHLVHLSKDCYNLLDNAKDIIEVNASEDPKYKVADE